MEKSSLTGCQPASSPSSPHLRKAVLVGGWTLLPASHPPPEPLMGHGDSPSPSHLVDLDLVRTVRTPEATRRGQGHGLPPCLCWAPSPHVLFRWWGLRFPVGHPQCCLVDICQAIYLPLDDNPFGETFARAGPGLNGPALRRTPPRLSVHLSLPGSWSHPRPGPRHHHGPISLSLWHLNSA